MHNYFERMYKAGCLIARDRIYASIPILSIFHVFLFCKMTHYISVKLSRFTYSMKGFIAFMHQVIMKPVEKHNNMATYYFTILNVV